MTGPIIQRRREIINFIADNFDSNCRIYVKGLKKKGIIEELSVFGVKVPSFLSKKSLESIYIIVLEEVIWRFKDEIKGSSGLYFK